jgi:hypothetical protein
LATLQDVENDQLNQQARALTLTELYSFSMSKMEMNIKGNEQKITGQFAVYYTHMKVSVKKEEANRLKKRKLLSSLLNMIIYPSNPLPGKPVRKVTVEITRDPYKSFFGFIWQSMSKAAVETITGIER